jgi:hypothetical protein
VDVHLPIVEVLPSRAHSGYTFHSEWPERFSRFVPVVVGKPLASSRQALSTPPETAERRPAFERTISKETRAYVLERNGYTCQMCGVAAGDEDPYNPKRTVRLTIGHIIEKDKGGSDEPGNLRALCTNCNEGLQNIAPPKPDRLQLLTYVRKATRTDQLAVLGWLLTKFKDGKL